MTCRERVNTRQEDATWETSQISSRRGVSWISDPLNILDTKTNEFYYWYDNKDMGEQSIYIIENLVEFDNPVCISSVEFLAHVTNLTRNLATLIMKFSGVRHMEASIL